MQLQRLVDRIEARRAQVAVVGLGYVGLPLALRFAEAGLHVTGVEQDPGRAGAVNRGESYVPDVNAERLALVTVGAGAAAGQGGPTVAAPPRGRLRATTDYEALREADAAIVCVPTPLGKTRDPDLSHILAATDAIAARLHDGMLVVVESTTFPGTTEELVLPRLRGSGPTPRVEGRDFFLAFSPERIDPGRTDWDVRTTPKVIGGVTPRCLAAAAALYRCAVDTVVPVSSPKTAELVKLLENTFRATNIALVNEFAIMCDRLGADVWEVIEAAKTKPFGFMPFYPGPGLGGHCLPIDPHYLAWKLRTLNYHARFVQLADEVNAAMPAHVVAKITDALNEAAKAVNGSRVLVLGVAYKANVGDTRESPAIEVIHRLRRRGAHVSYHDPYVPRLKVDGAPVPSAPLTERALRQADCVVIATAHESYDWDWVVRHARLVVDTRNATRGARGGLARVVRL